MADLANSFEMLMDTDEWMRFAAIGGGYMGSSVAQIGLDDRLPVDVPNEFYGVSVAGLSLAYAPAYEKEMAAGGGLYSLDAFAQRFGFKGQIRDIARQMQG